MINITDKKDCCGCFACVQKCPKHCITLEEDGEGFLYPKVDASACINCGLCEKVCPWLNRPEKIEPREVLAVKNRNEEERMASSSGGVFIALARKVIDSGGVVFGAVFDENWEVVHAYADTMDGVRPMMGSKYVQSRIGESYRAAERFLKEGREVLFTGTPCQVTGLHNYLRKDYPNLLSVDFLCHGVPSPGVWRRYLDETFGSAARRAAAGKNTVLSLSLKSVPVITGIDFRDKQPFGWKKFSFVVRGKSASKADENSVLLSDIHKVNPYMRGFLANIYLRPSCYQCKCKNGVSHSDLTIADFWGIWRLMPDFADDCGVSLVLVNTEKGEFVFSSLGLDAMESTFKHAQATNGGFKEHTVEHPKRSIFFGSLADGVSVKDAVTAALYVPAYRLILRRVKMETKHVIKKITKAFLGDKNTEFAKRIIKKNIS